MQQRIDLKQSTPSVCIVESITYDLSIYETTIGFVEEVPVIAVKLDASCKSFNVTAVLHVVLLLLFSHHVLIM